MDEILATAEKDVLVEIVKLCQKQGLKGSKGGWKEFLNIHDRKFGASVGDPARRSPDDLVAFIKTFTKEDNVKLFTKVIQSHSNREKFKKEVPDGETPEQRLVRLTLDHPQYPLDYSFPSHEEEWMVTKLSTKSKAIKSNAIVAVDCEMVLCDDGTEALVKVCVVDRNLQVKLNELVNPNKPIADYRTEITGVSAKDLDGITRSLADIQKSMKKLLSHGTILVGHSLNNDLKALKLDHARVIDTSFIFKCADESVFRRPSLNNLCKSVLGYEVRQKGAPHNCLDDACATMKLVLAKIERGFDNTIPLVREDVPEIELAKLLLHRIPIYVPSEELYKIIRGDCTIERQPSKRAGGEKYSAIATFKSPEEADKAYESVKGTQTKDSFGRPQKSVSFKFSKGLVAFIYVRKMANDDSLHQDSSKKRPFQVEDETLGESKKLKKDQKVEEDEEMIESADPLKEIERLKRELSQRDKEISNLQNLVAKLVRKQGL